MARRSGHLGDADRRVRNARLLVDVCIAVVIGVFTIFDVAEASSKPEVGERPADWFAYALVIVGSVSLVWRRALPITVLAVVTAALSLYWLRDHGAFLSVLGLPAVYAAAAHGDNRRRAWTAIALSIAVVMVTASLSLLDRPDGFQTLAFLSMLGFLIGAAVAGVIVRNRERIFVDTEKRAAAAEADRLAEAERAVLRERSRIAREMHDVVAHGISVIAVQAAAGREIVHADPHKAAEVFARIEAIGRESLTELRRMLGVLRNEPGAVPSLSPQPSIGDIEAAVAESSAAGVPTTLSVDGEPRELAPGTELTVFRIVQEALTNVRKHAGDAATASVRIAYEPRAVVVEVIDDGHGAATALRGVGTGHGLIGMRERVEIYDGELTAGPLPGGGFRVHARLPVSPDPAAGGSRPPAAASPGAGGTP